MPESTTERLRLQALRLLARRDHSRAELAQKLSGEGETELVAALLDDLDRQHLLSDARYARSRTAARAGRLGNARIASELRCRGIAEEEIAQALSESGDELGRCRVVWRKKFGQLPTAAKDFARQRRFLMGRGFSPQTIRQVLGGMEDETA